MSELATGTMTRRISVQTRGKGLYDITRRLAQLVSESGLHEGLCTVMIQHTSASLVIQENADRAVQNDLENWLSRLVREDDPLYTHRLEGADDMPAHVKAALTATTLSIPIVDGRLALGRWQAVYLWEHRRRPNARQCLVQIRP